MGATGLNEILDIAPLVPQEYAAYRPLIRDALLFFLERLPPHRQTVIVVEQLQMAEDTGLVDRVGALLHHCPTLHKLGQFVARNQHLAPTLRTRLQALEFMTPTTPVAEILETIQQELGDNPDVVVHPQALAEASVAVVVPFSYREAKSTHREGVFKILKPDIEALLQEDLVIWSALGDFLEERCGYYDLPALNYRETLDGVSSLLLNEIQLRREQEHIVDAARFYADTPDVFIPRLLPYSTPRMTAMERIYGCKITDTTLPPERCQKLATLAVNALIAKPFWDNASSVMFHADSHAGNLFATHDERLAILDWSLVAYLNKAQRATIMKIVLAALALDQVSICRALAALGKTPPKESLLRVAVADALGQVRQGTFPGFSWLLGLLDRLVFSATIEFSEDLLLFRKTLFTLSGVVADVSTLCSPNRVLLNSGLKQLLRELPDRVATFSDSDSLGTHVSNLDLLCLWASMPMATGRFWISHWREMVDALQAKPNAR